MAGNLVELARRYHAALNAFDFAAVEAMFASDAEYHSPSVGVIAGRAAILKAMRAYFAEYSDQIATDDILEQAGSDSVRCEWHLRATAKSTGEPYVRKGKERLVFTPDGLIRRIEVQDL